MSDKQLPWHSPLFYRDAHSVASGRVSFIEHAGRRILLVDFSRADLDLLKAVAAECLHVMTQEPEMSVLSLVDVEGTSLSTEGIKLGADLSERVRPHVQRTAVNGVTGLRSFVLETIVETARRPIKLFKDRPSALEWLINDHDSE
ncbi:MAG: hypothetical protein LAP21_07445 [Acidobacteriia bacterium]|nr:hypothetical protein [Terriglobia bacterium]